MSTKSRKRKSFLRYVNRLKLAPIYKVNDFIVIDEFAVPSVVKRNKRWLFSKHVENFFEDDKNQGKTYDQKEFDDIFNPDLFLDILFTNSRDLTYKIKKLSLTEIASSWRKRLDELFPEDPNTLVLYYIKKNDEWMLDFINLPKDQKMIIADEVYYF